MDNLTICQKLYILLPGCFILILKSFHLSYTSMLTLLTLFPFCKICVLVRQGSQKLDYFHGNRSMFTFHVIGQLHLVYGMACVICQGSSDLDLIYMVNWSMSINYKVRFSDATSKSYFIWCTGI